MSGAGSIPACAICFLSFGFSFRRLNMSGRKQITNVEVLRHELEMRFYEETEGRGVSDLLQEMALEPIRRGQEYPLFFERENKKRKQAQSGRRVPSRSEGAAPHSTQFGICAPPPNSMGVTNREIPDTQIKFICPAPSAPVSESRPRVLGGYDGGFSAGFIGVWSPVKFKQLIDTLEVAKSAAEEGKSGENYVTLAGRQFLVMPHGTREGASYKYIITGGGLKVLIHNNPQGDIQGIRIRYGFEALVGRDLFAVHAETLDWFRELGFTVTKETVSRADYQILTMRDVKEYIKPIVTNCAVKRAKEAKYHENDSRGITSYTCGSDIQLCIYDKRLELLKGRDEVKTSLMLDECLGGEFPGELTRIEFRLKRGALKYLGVNTVQDLLERERAIIDFLTYDWFRILNEEKSGSGHTNEQAMSPVWEEVRATFFEYFPGPVENR
jgi:hypothetical protein